MPWKEVMAARTNRNGHHQNLSYPYQEPQQVATPTLTAKQGAEAT